MTRPSPERLAEMRTWYATAIGPPDVLELFAEIDALRAERDEARAAALEEAAVDLERWASMAITEGANNEQDPFHVCGWDECCAQNRVRMAAARLRALEMAGDVEL